MAEAYAEDQVVGVILPYEPAQRGDVLAEGPVHEFGPARVAVAVVREPFHESLLDGPVGRVVEQKLAYAWLGLEPRRFVLQEVAEEVFVVPGPGDLVPYRILKIAAVVGSVDVLDAVDGFDARPDVSGVGQGPGLGGAGVDAP